MADLRVDYDDLQLLSSRLDRAIDQMHDDSSTMSSIAGAVGDGDLAGKIRDFADSWSVHRGNIRENVSWLQGQVDRIATELKARDDELANGLRG